MVGGVRAGVETLEARVAAEAGGLRATFVSSLGEVDGGGLPTSLTRALHLDKPAPESDGSHRLRSQPPGCITRSAVAPESYGGCR